MDRWLKPAGVNASSAKNTEAKGVGYSAAMLLNPKGVGKKDALINGEYDFLFVPM